jgi:probable F420-dependent oxidoreductase
MKFWQNVSWMETDQLIDLARHAETLGYEGVMDGDHFAFPVKLKTPYPLSEDGQPPMGSDFNYPDNFVSAGAIAVATARLRYMTDIFVLPVRHPLAVAKAAATVAILGGHRFVLGVAAGWMKDEFDLAGIDFATRGQRLDEMIAIMRKLWLGGPVEHHGRFFDFDPLRLEPMPGRIVPIFCAGTTKTALKRAALLGDGWRNGGNTLDEVAGFIAELKRLRHEAGRDHLPFEIVATLVEPPSLDNFKRLEDLGVHGTLVYPPHFALGRHSTLDQKKQLLETFAESFLRHFAA